MNLNELESRISMGEALFLDGAVGTQLQRLGVPMDNTAWAAAALVTHPSTVLQMHRMYIDQGVDIITTNTYSSARHNLEPLGLGDQVAELNLRAVHLAMEARERFAQKPLAVAGSISSFGLTASGESERALHRHARARTEISESQAIANLQEQARLLEDAGADLLIAECTGSKILRERVYEACNETALPTWLGFRVRWNDADQCIDTGYSSSDTLDECLDQLASCPVPNGIALFHSTIESIDHALPILTKRFQGTVVVYPEADRADYTARTRNEDEPVLVSTDDFVDAAKRWKSMGAHVIGGCCGIDVDYISAVRNAL